MLHESASRSARRAAPAGLALLVRQTVTPPGGLHREPSARSPRRRRTAERAAEAQRTIQMIMSGLGAAIMLGICGLGGFFIVADERRGQGAEAAGTPSADVPYGIASRQIDAEPLALAEVFPGSEIRLLDGAEPYRIMMTHIDAKCDIATTGELGPMLVGHGCSQVVRAAMTAPYGGYRVTAGILNLADADGAAQVGGQIRQLVETGDGTFAPLGAQPGVEPVTQVGWHERGHYLVYCVISRPDGAAMAADDQYAARITVDLLDSYLSGEVIGARTLDP